MIEYTVVNTDVIHDTLVDFILRPAAKVVNLIQYDDTLPKLKVKLLKNDKEFQVPDNTEMFIRYSKPDGTFVYNSALGYSADKKYVYFAITFQMTTNIGKLFAVVEMLHGSQRAASSPIQININKNPIQSDDIESQVELGIVEGLLHEAEAAVLQAQQYKNECEDIYNQIINMIGGGYVTLATEQHITGEKTIDRINIETLITFNQNGRTSGNIIPVTTTSYNLGSSTYKWNNIYAAQVIATKIRLGSTELDETKLKKLLELLEVFLVEEVS